MPLSGDLASVADSFTRDTFAKFDGDLNRDQSLNWADRLMMVDTVGSSIGDPGYTARADFDLDGTIDTSDMGAFVALFNRKYVPESKRLQIGATQPSGPLAPGP